MAYAIIAGVEPRYGIFAFIVGSVVGALFGSSRHLQTGPTNATSIVVASSLAVYAGQDNFMGIVFFVGFLAGAFQVLAGILRMGNLTHYLSRSVLTGFIAGAGLYIAVNQLPNLLGIHTEGGGTVLDGILHVSSRLGQTQPLVLGLGLGTIILSLGINRLSPKSATGIPILPAHLLAIICAAMIVVVFGLSDYGIEVIGDLPFSIPSPSTPVFTLELLQNLSPGAFAVALIGFAESSSASKTVATMSGDKLNPDREFLGQGLAKIASSFFSGIPVSASFTRSLLCFQAGGVTRVASGSSGLMLLVILLFLGPIAAKIPLSALAGIVMLIAVGMLDWSFVKTAIRTTRSDAIAVLATFSAAIVFPLVYAIYIGVGLSLVLILRRINRPRLIELDVDDREFFMELDDPEQRSVPGLSVVHVEGDVFFGAVDFMEEEIQRIAKREDLKVLILRMKRAACLDATSIMTLIKIHLDLRSNDKLLLICGATPEIQRIFRRSGLDRVVGQDKIFSSSNIIFESTHKARKYALDYLKR